jgi:hypothetical protein
MNDEKGLEKGLEGEEEGNKREIQIIKPLTPHHSQSSPTHFPSLTTCAKMI